MCLPSWIMVGRWGCWRSSAAILASRNANGCRNWIYSFREIFCVRYFSLGQRLRIGAQKWIIVARAANPPRSELSTRPHRGGGLRLVWITRRRFVPLGFIELFHAYLWPRPSPGSIFHFSVVLHSPREANYCMRVWRAYFLPSW